MQLFEYLNSCWPDSKNLCDDGTRLTIGRSAKAIYNGTERPDFWMIVLAYVNLEESKRTLIALLNRVSEGANSEVSERIALLDLKLDVAQLRELHSWFKMESIHSVLSGAARNICAFLRDPNETGVEQPMLKMIQYLQDRDGLDLQQSRTRIYEMLREEVSFETFTTLADGTQLT